MGKQNHAARIEREGFVPSNRREESPKNAPVAERVQAILASKGLTLYWLSRQSAALYGRSSPYLVPHNLYHALRNRRFTPSIHQILSLSRISNYGFFDWLRVFGFDLENITRLQVLLPCKRTMVLDTSLTDPNQCVPWFRNRELREPVPPIAPLSQLLATTAPRPIKSLPQTGHHFRYAKIGNEDSLAFPEIVPGSIVRVDPDIGLNVSGSNRSAISDRIFLIEHGRGFWCCRVRQLAKDVVIPVDNRFSSSQAELHCPRDARIWGAVDLEFRPLRDVREPHIPKDLARRSKSPLLSPNESFGRLLRQARRQMRISIREGARLSQMVAQLLGDDRYTISSSSLSHYELHNAPPRDFHKIITLCSIYGLQFHSAIRSMGINLSDSGTESIPDRLPAREDRSGARKHEYEGGRAGFLESLLVECQNEVAFFMRRLFGYFAGPVRVSLDDFFWIGGNRDPLHPYLVNGLMIMVNRRRKTPLYFLSKPVWQQPIHLVLAREDNYLPACCSIEGGKLVVHPYGPDHHRSPEYRHRLDAEVVGQVVAILRRVL